MDSAAQSSPNMTDFDKELDTIVERTIMPYLFESFEHFQTREELQYLKEIAKEKAKNTEEDEEVAEELTQQFERMKSRQKFKEWLQWAMRHVEFYCNTSKSISRLGKILQRCQLQSCNHRAGISLWVCGQKQITFFYIM